MLELITVDQSICVRCGQCAVVCPRGLIHLHREWPESMAEELCIGCGHCVAVCPVAALDNRLAPRAGQTAVPTQNFTTEAAYQFLRSRRSIRCFKKQPVEREKIVQLLELARLAPSGGNSQGIAYLVIENRSVLGQLTAATIDWLDEQSKQGIPAAKTYSQYVSMYREQGKDSILRDAPCLIVAHAAASFVRGRENSLFALAYAELYAPALGLGSCWAGLMEAAVFAGAPLVKLLGLPADRQFSGAIMLGYPAVQFHRLPDRKPLELKFMEE
jgi:nitroreductase/NAD-dependent dihydropyrimidine dehydrogenase PreA subunit